MKDSFKVLSFRRIPLFSKNSSSESFYVERSVAIVDVVNLPGDFPTGTNPRDVNDKTLVAKKIRQSLTINEDFHVLNRGIMISAKTIHYDNETGELTVDFGGIADAQNYGVVDGGHTYAIIQQATQDSQIVPETRYVSVEFFTGLDDRIVEFAEARNTSVSVDDKSLLELSDSFKFIQDALNDKPYFDKISWKQNQAGDVDIREILALMVCFDKKRYNDGKSQPVTAYAGLEQCVKLFKQDEKPDTGEAKREHFRPLVSILPEILDFADYVRYRMPAIHNDNGGRFGSHTAAKKSSPEFVFRKDLQSSEQRYDVLRPYWIPVVAAFRALVDYDKKGKAFFKYDPIEVFEKKGPELVNNVFEAGKKLSPNSLGKDTNLWKQLYNEVLIWTLTQ